MKIDQFDVKALRAFRVLRPLRLVSGVPSEFTRLFDHVTYRNHSSSQVYKLCSTVLSWQWYLSSTSHSWSSLWSSFMQSLVSSCFLAFSIKPVSIMAQVQWRIFWIQLLILVLYFFLFFYICRRDDGGSDPLWRKLQVSKWHWVSRILGGAKLWHHKLWQLPPLHAHRVPVHHSRGMDGNFILGRSKILKQEV